MTIPKNVRTAAYTLMQRHLTEPFANDEERWLVLRQADDACELLDAWLDTQSDAPIPDWTTAPDWAQWWAVDANGMVWWYATQPEYLNGDGTEWDGDQQTRRVGLVDLPLGVDWRTTLRRRPEVTE